MKRWTSVIGFMLFLVGTAQGRELKDVDLTDAKMPASRAELHIDKGSWEKLQTTYSIEDILCSGSETMLLPALGKCPDRAGYVTVGFPICTQACEVPRTFTFQEIVPGWIRLVCTLDFANLSPLEEPSCDYSQCFYIEEPEFPLTEFPVK